MNSVASIPNVGIQVPSGACIPSGSQPSSEKTKIKPVVDALKEATGLALLLQKIIAALTYVWKLVTCGSREARQNADAIEALLKKQTVGTIDTVPTQKPVAPVDTVPAQPSVPTVVTVPAPKVAVASVSAPIVAEPARMVSLDELFLPVGLATKIVRNESHMKTVAKLLFKTGIGTIHAFTNRKLADFDPLVGDSGCERRGLKIYTLASSAALLAEAQALKSVLDANQKELSEREGKLAKEQRIEANKSKTEKYDEKKGKKEEEERVKIPTTSQFFTQKVQAIKISEEMAYLMQSYFLTLTKAVARDRETNLIVRTYSGAEKEVNDPTRLIPLSIDLNNPSIRKAVELDSIVDCVKAQLAMSSYRSMQSEISKIATSVLDANGKEVLQAVMAASLKDEKLTYRCFHSFKCIILRLRELQALVVVKEMIPLADPVRKKKADKSKKDVQPAPPPPPVPKAKPKTLLYRASTTGDTFVPVAKSEYAALKDRPVVVMEAAMVSGMSCAQLADKIKAVGGLERLLLANAAIIDDPEDLTNEAARREIEFYQRAAQEMGYVKTGKKETLSINNPFLLMDHVFCSVVSKEIQEGGN